MSKIYIKINHTNFESVTLGGADSLEEEYMKLNKKIMVITVISLFLWTSVIFSVAEVNSIVNVNDTIIVPDDYRTIQRAIDNASYGDTIYVKNGEYHENIVIDIEEDEEHPDKILNIIGANSNYTVIEGCGKDAVIRIISDNINFVEFTVRNGAPDGAYAGSGVHLSASNCNISNCIITENNKIGLFIFGDNNRVSGNSISNNVDWGIHVINSEGNIIYHNNFLDNDKNNAWDLYGDNNWYDPASLEGNYWDDYNGSDTDSDGIGDTNPYGIPPDQTENQDKYPFMNFNGWYFYPPPLVPDLTCIAHLSWSEVKPGANVSGTITIINKGDPGSLLNWDITDYPDDWGEWIIVPLSGDNLRPEDGSQTVAVIIEAPDEGNKHFNGTIIVKNRDNTSDFCSIPISITTPKNKVINLPFVRFLERYQNIFPMLQRLLQVY